MKHCPSTSSCPSESSQANPGTLHVEIQALKNPFALPHVLSCGKGRFALASTKLRSCDLGRGSSFQQKGISYYSFRYLGDLRSSILSEKCSMNEKMFIKMCLKLFWE